MALRWDSNLWQSSNLRLAKTNLRQDTNAILNTESLEKIQGHIDSLNPLQFLFQKLEREKILGFMW
jgi:hypothetical protein